MEECEFVHLPLNQEVRSISGGYILEKEARVTVDGREILYAVGVGVVDSACCGTGGSRYALVPGILVRWHSGINADGHAVSKVVRIQDPDLTQKVASAIRAREREIAVQFL
ncbi:MAG: hypothetical protein AB1921_17535 [Thermodesulfobacteriota bacterium]